METTNESERTAEGNTVNEFSKLELTNIDEFNQRLSLALSLAEINSSIAKNTAGGSVFSNTYILKHVMGMTDEEIKLNNSLLKQGL